MWTVTACNGLSPAEASVTLGQPQPSWSPGTSPGQRPCQRPHRQLHYTYPFLHLVSAQADKGHRDALTIFTSFLSFFKLSYTRRIVIR
ncbi:hypothetical protein N658DRAFT_498087 [Parathielavia hyrcaniae]|uniref:Uncharacterized protein n=1 Tax=Parathielavia hyrcaniae TaxID=113614 RepID=A0AAN6PXW3_9PEZI|nr:hypothetical protein N658DRAFT_498087 [Parathielavia hyrcaniae]